MSNTRQRSLQETSVSALKYCSKVVSSLWASRHPARGAAPRRRRSGAAQAPSAVAEPAWLSGDSLCCRFPQSSGGLSCPSALSTAGRIQPCNAVGLVLRRLPRSPVGHSLPGDGGTPNCLGPTRGCPLPILLDVPGPVAVPGHVPQPLLPVGYLKPLSAGGFRGLSSAQEACERPARDGFAGNREKTQTPKPAAGCPHCSLPAEPTAPLPPGCTCGGSSPKSIPLCPLPAQGPCPLPGTAFSLHPQPRHPQPEPLTAQEPEPRELPLPGAHCAQFRSCLSPGCFFPALAALRAPLHMSLVFQGEPVTFLCLICHRAALGRAGGHSSFLLPEPVAAAQPGSCRAWRVGEPVTPPCPHPLQVQLHPVPGQQEGRHTRAASGPCSSAGSALGGAAPAPTTLPPPGPAASWLCSLSPHSNRHPPPGPLL